jgi:hypothetical protein
MAKLLPSLEPSPISSNTGQNLTRSIGHAVSQLSQHIDVKLVERFHHQFFRSQYRTQEERQNLSAQIDFAQANLAKPRAILMVEPPRREMRTPRELSPALA